MEILAACHLHSEWSYDAKWPLAALTSKFRERGCRVLMTTEHDRGFTSGRWDEYRQACRQASSETLLVVPGLEYSDSANRVHVLVWGPVPFLGEGLATVEMLRRVKAANGVAVLAHPSRKILGRRLNPSGKIIFSESSSGTASTTAGLRARPGSHFWRNPARFRFCRSGFSH